MDCTVDGSAAQPASILGSSSGELVMRVDGGDYRGEIIRFRGPKLTLGSSRKCTFAVAAEHVRPVQCLILRGRGVTIVRSWTPDTRLNGRSFSDAVLRLGDRLQLGPVRFEILDDGRPVLDAATDGTRHAPLPMAREESASLDDTARIEHWLQELEPATGSPAPSPQKLLVAFAEVQQRLLAELEALARERAAWQAERSQWEDKLDDFLRRAAMPVQAPLMSEPRSAFRDAPGEPAAPGVEPPQGFAVVPETRGQDDVTTAHGGTAAWTEPQESDAAPESYSVEDLDSASETYTPAFADDAESAWQASPADESAAEAYTAMADSYSSRDAEPASPAPEDAEPASPAPEDVGAAASGAPDTPADGPDSLRALLKSIWRSDPLADAGTKSASDCGEDAQDGDAADAASEPWAHDGDEEAASTEPYSDNEDAGAAAESLPAHRSAADTDEEPIPDPTFVGLDDPGELFADAPEQDQAEPSPCSTVRRARFAVSPLAALKRSLVFQKA
jgi:hypothetical protein